MDKLVCDICGGKLIAQAGGVYVCDSCGTESRAESHYAQGTETPKHAEQTVQQKASEPSVAANNDRTDTDTLIKRIFLLLEDGDWAGANCFCEKLLDEEPENSQAYLARLMIELRICRPEFLKNAERPFDDSGNYQKALRFADPQLAEKLRGDIRYIKERNENARLDTAYANAVNAMNNANGEQAFRAAEAQFSAIKDYRDANMLAARCAEQADMLRDAEAKSRGDKRRKKLTALLAVLVISAAAALYIFVISPPINYGKAEEAAKGAHYAEAAGYYIKCGGYKDSRKKLAALTEKFNESCSISAGTNHFAALRAEGTVAAAGDNGKGQCNVSEWKNITAVSAGQDYTIGLRADGTVAAAGENGKRQCAVSMWRNIVAVSAGSEHTVGLKSDGRVVCTGSDGSGQCRTSHWRNIVGVSAGLYHTVGLKADGTVVAVGDNKYGQCNVSDWKDIVAISAGTVYTVGLKADGTVVAAGSSEMGRCDVSEWKDIVAVSAGACHTVGLKADGTVVSTKYSGAADNDFGQFGVQGWKNISAVSAGVYNTMGLKSDGMVVCIGKNESGAYETSALENIRLPD